MSPFKRKRTKFKKPVTPLMWFAIISLIAVLLAAVLGLGGGAINFIEQYFGYRDDSYRPLDTERRSFETLPKQTNPSNQLGP